MDELDPAELSISIPLRSIYEFFICPICFEDITDCHMTTCGHAFCEECIRECLNRKHVCPLCQQQTEEKLLVKNHHLDAVLSKILSEKELEANRYMQQLMSPRIHDQDNPVRKTFSPIETVFQRYARQSLIAYEDFYKKLEETYAKKKAQAHVDSANELEKITATLKAELRTEKALQELPEFALNDDEKGVEPYDISSQLPPELKRTDSVNEAIERTQAVIDRYQQQIMVIQGQFDHCVSLLVANYEQHMINIAPSPFVLPIPVVLRFLTRNQFFDASVISTTLISDLREIYKSKMFDIGNPIVDFGDDSQILMKRSHDDQYVPLEDESLTLFEAHVEAKTEFFISGMIKCSGDAKPVCFTYNFENNQEMTTDYFHCRDCGINWICSSCSKYCHQGHNLKSFRKNHAPSYACCYCVKKKLCILDNKKTKKKS